MHILATNETCSLFPSHLQPTHTHTHTHPFHCVDLFSIFTCSYLISILSQSGKFPTKPPFINFVFSNVVHTLLPNHTHHRLFFSITYLFFSFPSLNHSIPNKISHSLLHEKREREQNLHFSCTSLCKTT